MTILPDSELRKMRDKIYGPQTDRHWDDVRDAWTKDYLWLTREYAKLIAKEAKV